MFILLKAQLNVQIKWKAANNPITILMNIWLSTLVKQAAVTIPIDIPVRNCSLNSHVDCHLFGLMPVFVHKTEIYTLPARDRPKFGYGVSAESSQKYGFGLVSVTAKRNGRITVSAENGPRGD